MESIVISFGGSVILSEYIDNHFYNKLADLLNKLSENYKFYIVVGGGRSAREYIKIGRKLNLDEETLDIFGILITRINAKLLNIMINQPNSKIPKTTNEALKIKKRIIIMGGTIPGHSTDYVGSELALKSKAKLFIIATNVNGVYDKDPNKFHNAKQIKEITAEKLINKYGASWQSAGSNVIIDGPALKMIKKNNIVTYVLNGNKIEELERAINGKNFDGTIIKKN